MVRPDSPRRLIVTADDFGYSSSVNQAVARAHADGILTTASLMVGGDAFDEAVRIARSNPRLGVGLHLTLLAGRSCLPQNELPGLVNGRQQFSNKPVWTGLSYFFLRSLRHQIASEIAAQLRCFKATGLVLDHVSGHLNIHLHPTVIRLLLARIAGPRMAPVRLTRDPFTLSARIARGRWAYRLSHAVIFSLIGGWTKRSLLGLGVPHTRAVFGLLQTGFVDEQYLLKLLPRLPAGDSELYSHPSLDHSRIELDALISPRVMEAVRDSDIQLIRYQDLLT